jgi:hypothetical protein
METTTPPTPQPQAPRVATPMSNVSATASNLVKKIPKIDLKNHVVIAVLALVVVLVGVGSGWLLSGNKTLGVSKGVAPGAKSTSQEAGMVDEATFKDSAEGILEEGGISGEGTHHLVRPGGDSQNVYLTSTVVDMQSFVGKKVTVWGQTISARKAGWLMDVGKIKVTE